MSYQRLFTNAIADILLVGDWQPQSMIKRVYWLLQSEPFWVVYLVDKLYSKFNADFPNVTNKQLSEFIVNDQQFLEIWHQQRYQLRIRRYHLQRIPTPTAKLQCDIPPLQTIRDLAVWLNLSAGQLENYSANWRITNQPFQMRLGHYHYRWLQKPSTANGKFD